MRIFSLLILLFAVTPCLQAQKSQVFFRQADSLYKRDKLPEALLRLDSALVENPGMTEARIFRGQVLLELGLYASAFQDYTQVLKTDSLNSEAYYFRGITMASIGEVKPALDDLNKAVSIGKKEKYYFTRGVLFDALELNEEALLDFGAVTGINPGNDSAYFNMGALYDRTGDLKKAIEMYTKCLSLNPGSEDALFNRAMDYDETGNAPAAIDDYTTLIKLNAKDPDAFFNRGSLYFEAGDYNKAIDDFNQVVLLDPAASDAYYNRGIAYYRSGRPEQACTDIQLAIALGDPDAKRFYKEYCK